MDKNLDNDDFSDLETLFQETASTSKTKNPRQIEEDPLRTWLRSKLTPVHYLTPKECQASSVQHGLSSVSRRDKNRKGQEEEARPDTPNPDTDDPALWLLAPIYAAGFITGVGVLWLLGIITIPMCPHNPSLNVSHHMLNLKLFIEMR